MKSSYNVATLVFLQGRFRRNVLGNYSVVGAQLFLALFLTPFYTHQLGMGDFGLWILLNTVFAYFHVMTWGLMPSVVRYVAHHIAVGQLIEIRLLFRSNITVLGLLSVAAVPLAFAVSSIGPELFKLGTNDAAEFQQACLLFGGITFLSFFNIFLGSVCKGFQRYDLLNLAVLTSLLPGTAIKVILLLEGHGLQGLVWAHLMQTLLEGLILTTLLFRSLHISIAWYLPLSLRRAREKLSIISRYTHYSGLNKIANIVSYRADVLVIGLLLPISAIVYFEIARKLASLVPQLINPIVNLLFPLSSELASAGQESALSNLLIEGTRLSLLIITPFVLVLGFFASEIIELWMGAAYVKQTVPLLYILLGAVVMAVFEAPASRILIGRGNIRFDALLSLATAALNLFLSVVLAYSYGVLGVAMGTLIASSLSHLLVSVPYTCKVMNISVRTLYANSLLPVLVVVGIGMPILFTIRAEIAHNIGGPVIGLALLLGLTGTVIAAISKRATI